MGLGTGSSGAGRGTGGAGGSGDGVVPVTLRGTTTSPVSRVTASATCPLMLDGRAPGGGCDVAMLTPRQEQRHNSREVLKQVELAIRNDMWIDVNQL